MDLQLSDRIALVSGSTAGIGLAIATTLAQEGATVIVNGRTEERVNNAIKSIQQSAPHAKLQGITADLGTPAGAELLFQQVPEVNILVNNLGIYGAKPFEDISDEEWINFIEVNVMSGVRLSRHYLPLMLKKDWGRIIFISSESGLNIPVEMIHYGVTKTAQIALARGLAETTAGSQVTVNTVLPGPTRSEGVETFIEGLAKEQNISAEQVEKEFFTKTRPSSLIQRFASTSEVAALVAFVASPLASAINGAALRVEGGVVRSIV
ncbi:SDR family NAD(P)-dependent oxidoreductase [Kamptonema animale CS-326]|jgi:NAD(P)-dependent dehydrogenase (short-subunit alcohol dehydrogenase family)|uniref:SDR family NAD(P)-dependent oxidoreductase n=1 Tax=Kamptonema animale TaxID=92934 RepID=UPI00232C23D9|nr:SDR family oxidoreductase [Kamptonema animale]MDB9511403.1 SDR family NAD(P)-dependent oxidoreductase [Kamptonema animale CS-326]